MANGTQNPPPATVPTKVSIAKRKNPLEDIDVSAEIVADGTSTDPSVQGDTSFQPEGALPDGRGGKSFFQTPGYSYEKQKGLDVVVRLTGPMMIKGTIKIQTIYGPSASPTQTSGYGRGTTPDDLKAGNTSLGFHESCHRSDYLNYLKTTALPAFGGKVGMSRQQYEQAAAAFAAAMNKYFADMKQDSLRRTDEVGYSMSTYKTKGPRP